jgi:hypothetical protein
VDEYRFNAYEPAGPDTYIKATRIQAYRELRNILSAHRSQLPRPVLWHLCGSVSTRVSTLYDAGHPDAYHLLCRFEQVKGICNLIDQYADNQEQP